MRRRRHRFMRTRKVGAGSTTAIGTTAIGTRLPDWNCRDWDRHDRDRRDQEFDDRDHHRAQDWRGTSESSRPHKDSIQPVWRRTEPAPNEVCNVFYVICFAFTFSTLISLIPSPPPEGHEPGLRRDRHRGDQHGAFGSGVRLGVLQNGERRRRHGLLSHFGLHHGVLSFVTKRGQRREATA